MLLSSNIPPSFFASRFQDAFWGFLQIILETNCISQARWKHYGLFAASYGVRLESAILCAYSFFSPLLFFRFSSSLPFSRMLHACARAGVGFMGYCTPSFHYLRVSTMRTHPSITYFSLSVFLVSVCSSSLLIIETHVLRYILKSTV